MHFLLLRKDTDDRGREVYRFLTEAFSEQEAKRDLLVASSEFDCILVELVGECKRGEVKDWREINK
jgi:flagellar biosynthesis/type III secretory pathway ATPase